MTVPGTYQAPQRTAHQTAQMKPHRTCRLRYSRRSCCTFSVPGMATPHRDPAPEARDEAHGVEKRWIDVRWVSAHCERRPGAPHYCPVRYSIAERLRLVHPQWICHCQFVAGIGERSREDQEFGAKTISMRAIQR